MSVKGLFVNAKDIRAYAPGEVVFAEGDTGREMYGVVSGIIELSHNGSPIVQIGPEGTFGELAIIDHAPRSLTATAVEPSQVAFIDEKTFLYLVTETPTFALSVMRALAARIRQINEQV
jgi:CRP-like cAMP-binding protein